MFIAICKYDGSIDFHRSIASDFEFAPYCTIQKEDHELLSQEVYPYGLGHSDIAKCA